MLALFSSLAWSWQRWQESLDKSPTSPGARRGHSLVLLDTPLVPEADDGALVQWCSEVTSCKCADGGTLKLSDVGKECKVQKVILFGGRSEDMLRPHTPETYRIEEINGSLAFATYEKKLVDEDADKEVPSGKYYNDVWQYDLDCIRWADQSCRTTSWTPLDKGANNGGCRIVQGEEVCTHPSERWLHGASSFRNTIEDKVAGTVEIKGDMLVYGGFSHRCEDYCDDMWRFNFEDNSWTEVVPLGRLRGTYQTQKGFGPGKRTRFSVAQADMLMVVFGGFRLWHGFMDHNTEDNDWSGDGLMFDIQWREHLHSVETLKGRAVCIQDGWRVEAEGNKEVLMDINTRNNMELAVENGRIKFVQQDIFVRTRPTLDTDAWIEGHMRRTPDSDGWRLEYRDSQIIAGNTIESIQTKTFPDADGSVYNHVENGQLELLNDEAQSQYLPRVAALTEVRVSPRGTQKRVRRRLTVVDDWVAGIATKTEHGWDTEFEDGSSYIFRDVSKRLSLIAHIEESKVEIGSRPVAENDMQQHFEPLDAIQLVKLATVLMPRNRGGYLDDVWVYNKETQAWRAYRKRQVCSSDYVLDQDRWEDRDRKKCVVTWPPGRAGHVSVLHGNHLYIHGGYRTFFPYPTSGGAGAGPGISSAAQPGFASYPQSPVFLGDMWRFDLTTGIWEQVVPFSKAVPEARLDHVMVRADDMFIMFGGLANNFYFSDTWMYNITGNHWVKKTQFVHARFPKSCTDDLRHRRMAEAPEVPGEGDPEILCEKGVRCYNIDKKCRGAVVAVGGKPMCRYGTGDPWFASRTPVFEQGQEKVCGDDECTNYMPDSVYLQRKDVENSGLTGALSDFEYARAKEYYFNDGTHYGCCTYSQIRPEDQLLGKISTAHTFSVIAEPTRKNGTVVLLKEFENRSVKIFQARRQAPGWDGCRDRADGRTDLPNELLWLHPTQRAGHAAVWSPGTRNVQRKYGKVAGDYYEPNDFLLVYGGHGFEEIQKKRFDRTPKATTLGDMWMFRIHDCPKNCSLHGMCRYGSCFCDDGYYGVDCSNSSCPGDFCYYDTSGEQHCTHCCSATYEQPSHVKHPKYFFDKRKTPCSLQHPGESHGVCDGFGKCLCAPPFIGADCSIRDCEQNCSGHGDCSVEYPNSRCLCDVGWTGKVCDYQLCVNNCSYPNGVCVNGSCYCSMTYSPFNRTREYWPWMGDDCSWRVPYAAGAALRPPMWAIAVLAFATALELMLPLSDSRPSRSRSPL